MKARVTPLNSFLADIITGSHLSWRLKPLLEVLFVALTVIVVIAMATGYYSQLTTQTVISEGMTLSARVRVEMLSFRSEKGRWPDTSDDIVWTRTKSRYIDRLDVVPGGGIAVRYRSDIGRGPGIALSGRTLTFSAATVKGLPDSQAVWLCAGQPIPPGMSTFAVNRTDVPRKLLPPICRGPE